MTQPSSPDQTTAAPGASRPIELDDLPRILALSDPQIAPDGSRIAYVAKRIDEEANEARSHVAVVDVPADWGPPSTSRQMTAGEHRDTDPRWSPDGRALAFVSDRTGRKQLYVLPLDGGEARGVTEHPVGATDPAWSPDGTRLAFVATGAERSGEPVPVEEEDPRRRVVRVTGHRHRLEGDGYAGAGRRHVWVVDLRSGEARQVTDGPADDASPAWSPDGSEIAFMSDRSDTRDRNFGGEALHVVRLVDGAVRRLSREGATAAVPSWSADGAWIAWAEAGAPLSVSGRQTHLWVVRPDGSDARCLTSGLDYSVGHRPGGYLSPSRPSWGTDGAVWYLLSEGTVSRLARFPLDAAGPDGIEAVTGTDMSVLSFSWAAGPERAAIQVSDAATPPEVWAWDAASGARPATYANAPLLAELRPARRRRVAAVRPDGHEIEGWLFAQAPRQPSPAGYPLVLVVHGGPHNYFGETWNADLQLLAAKGYAVLAVNPRGSGGRSEAFARAVVGDWGGGDHDDLLAVVDTVIEQADPPIDPARLAITGGSYGGFMTCWALGQSDRFRVGVAGAPVTNLPSMFGTSDIGPSWLVDEVGGLPWVAPDAWRGRSPLANATAIHAPLLLYHGEADLRVPIEQSEQLFAALHTLGRTVELLRVPAEGHVLPGDGSPVHARAVREAIIDWLGRHL